MNKEEEEEVTATELRIAEGNKNFKFELPESSPLRRLVAPHKIKSRDVTEDDLERVAEDAKVLHDICYENYGIYRGAFAMHHSQIDDKDPLNFFVTSNYRIIMNPIINRHSGYTTDSKEGCMSFPDESPLVIQRWQKVDVEYVTVMIDPEDKEKFTISNPIQDHFTGQDAKVFQHEFDHGIAKFIYDIPEKEEQKQ